MLKGALADVKEEIRILSVFGFGHATSPEAFSAGLNQNPHVIVGQGTSTDPGPYQLGMAEHESPYHVVKELYRPILKATSEKHIPFILSGGTPGEDITLGECLRVMREICDEDGYHLRIAVIHGQLEKDYLLRQIERGTKIRRLVETPRLSEYLTSQDLNNATRVVAQMGPEPIMKALESGVDGVLTGRALDVGLFMAAPLQLGFDKALAAHLGKSIECGAFVTEPSRPNIILPTTDAVLGILRKDHFLVRALHPDARCTVMTVAAHAFYERPDPFRELNPGGALDIAEASYEQYDDRTVKVTGSKWIPAKYTVKVEGVSQIGFRASSIAGIRDPAMVQQIDTIIEYVRKQVRDLLPYEEDSYKLDFRIYGKNGVMGDWEPEKEIRSYELGILIDAFGKTEEIAEAVCTTARNNLQACGFQGRLSTAGNLAFPMGYMLFRAPSFIYSIWHLLPLDDPCEPFKIEYVNLGR